MRLRRHRLGLALRPWDYRAALRWAVAATATVALAPSCWSLVPGLHGGVRWETGRDQSWLQCRASRHFGSSAPGGNDARRQPAQARAATAVQQQAPVFERKKRISDRHLYQVTQREDFNWWSLPVDPMLTANGDCLHIPEFACERERFALMTALAKDMRKCGKQLGMHRSGKHLVMYGEALKDSAPFRKLISRVLSTFRVSLVDCWVNMYRGGQDMKTAHFDNYKDRTPRPTMTIGISLGDSRDLEFTHVDTGEQIRVKQGNGDLFAFDTAFNGHFTHAIPPGTDNTKNLRISIIVWANARPPSPVVIRKKTKGWRDEVPLMVSWKDWDSFLADGYAKIEEGMFSYQPNSIPDDVPEPAPETSVAGSGVSAEGIPRSNGRDSEQQQQQRPQEDEDEQRKQQEIQSQMERLQRLQEQELEKQRLEEELALQEEEQRAQSQPQDMPQVQEREAQQEPQPSQPAQQEPARQHERQEPSQLQEQQEQQQQALRPQRDPSEGPPMSTVQEGLTAKRKEDAEKEEGDALVAESQPSGGSRPPSPAPAPEPPAGKPAAALWQAAFGAKPNR